VSAVKTWRRLAFCFIAMALACGCSESYPTYSSRAPNGAVAVVSHDAGGGATIDYTWYVDLYPNLRDAQVDWRGVEVWSCYGVGPDSLTWVPETHRLIFHVRAHNLQGEPKPRVNEHKHFGWKAQLQTH
jgi:hypothetical protein